MLNSNEVLQEYLASPVLLDPKESPVPSGEIPMSRDKLEGRKACISILITMSWTGTDTHISVSPPDLLCCFWCTFSLSLHSDPGLVFLGNVQEPGRSVRQSRSSSTSDKYMSSGNVGGGKCPSIARARWVHCFVRGQTRFYHPRRR